MIQRIQTLYILIAIALMALTSSLPLINIMDSEGQLLTSFASGITQDNAVILKTIPLFILTISTVIINTIALLAFKKRMIQIRLLIFSIVLQMGSYLLGAYYLIQITKNIEATTAPGIAAIFPLIATIVAYLAIRAIGKDEALVRSLDRIR